MLLLLRRRLLERLQPVGYLPVYLFRPVAGEDQRQPAEVPILLQPVQRHIPGQPALAQAGHQAAGGFIQQKLAQ